MGSNLMTVSIIFIGTDKYLNFLPQYHERVTEKLFPGVEKKIFAFTDGDLEGEVPDDIIPIKIEHKPWPRITLERFHTILSAKDQLLENDYVLFLDADMYVNQEVRFDEVFNDKDFVGVHHPCHMVKAPPHDKAPGSFEPNRHSTAYLENAYDFGVYWQGCLWGGKTEPVIEMMETICARIDEDDENGITAIWHDETHLNKFFCENFDQVHTLNSNFAFPECYPDFPFNQTIIHLAKDNSKYHV